MAMGEMLFLDDPDKDFRLLFNEIDNRYYIQKRRLFGYKFITYKTLAEDEAKLSFTDHNEAKERLSELREENKKYKVKGKYIILDD